MRSIGHPDYRYRPISAKRKAKLSEIHRKRWGAPEGFCTVRGVHVPFEHRPPVRYWSDWIAYHQGEERARQWIQGLRDAEWADMPAITEIFNQRKEIARTRDAIRAAQWELVHGH